MKQKIKRIVVKVRYYLQLFISNNIPIKFINKIEYPHPIGIVIGSGSKIGNGVVIYQNVTIGRGSIGAENQYPEIKNNVIIYPGAVIYGKIVVGEGAIIGANATVSKDIPPNSIVEKHNVIRNRK